MYFIGRLCFQSHGIILKSFLNQGSMIFLVSFSPNFSDNFTDKNQVFPMIQLSVQGASL